MESLFMLEMTLKKKLMIAPLPFTLISPPQNKLKSNIMDMQHSFQLASSK